jgi:hypothetical protein
MVKNRQGSRTYAEKVYERVKHSLWSKTLFFKYLLIYSSSFVFNDFQVPVHWSISSYKTLYLHLVLFRTYYFQVAVWFMRPYFRRHRHVTLIVNMTSQYKSTPRRIMNSFATSYRLCQRFLNNYSSRGIRRKINI